MHPMPGIFASESEKASQTGQGVTLLLLGRRVWDILSGGEVTTLRRLCGRQSGHTRTLSRRCHACTLLKWRHVHVHDTPTTHSGRTIRLPFGA
jgi:hypothetical protein